MSKVLLKGMGAGLLLASLVVACCNAPSLAAREEITLGIPWAIDIYDSLFPEIVELYAKHNTSIRVNLEVGWDPDKQIMAAAGGAGADILFNSDQLTDPQYQGAVFQPLDSLMRRQSFATARFLPDSLAVMNGQTYAIKLFIDPNWPLFYNKTLMAEHGVNPDTPPTTIAELETVFPKLTVWGADGALKRIAMTPWTGGNKGFMFIWGQTFGAKQWEGQEASGRFNFVSPAWIRAMSWQQDFLQRYASHTPNQAKTGFGQQIQRFVEGQQVIGYSVTGHLGDLDRNSTYEWGLAAPMTTPEGSHMPMWFGGFRFGISRFSKNAEAAFDFLTFLTSDPEVSLLLAERNLFPAYRNAVGLQAMVQRDGRWRQVIDAISLAEGTPYVPPVAEWTQAVNVLRQDLATGIPARTALETMQRTLDAAARQAGYTK